MQRHSVPAMPSRICASVGCGFLSSSALAVMIWPFWQKPHCGTCSSIQACCSGCSLPSLREPFERRDLASARSDSGVMHDRIADAVDDHRARAALAEPAAEARALQAEIVAQDVEQRRRRLDVHRVRGAVDLQCDRAHARCSILIAESPDSISRRKSNKKYRRNRQPQQTRGISPRP